MQPLFSSSTLPSFPSPSLTLIHPSSSPHLPSTSSPLRLCILHTLALHLLTLPHLYLPSPPPTSLSPLSTWVTSYLTLQHPSCLTLRAGIVLQDCLSNTSPSPGPEWCYKDRFKSLRDKKWWKQTRVKKRAERKKIWEWAIQQWCHRTCCWFWFMDPFTEFVLIVKSVKALLSKWRK